MDDVKLTSNIEIWIGIHSFFVCCPVVLGSLRNLSTTTSILTDPAVVPQQAKEAVQK